MILINNKYYKDVSKQGLGNRLFQYCFAREIAERKNYTMSCEPILGFPETKKEIVGDYVFDDVIVTPPATQMFDMELIYNHSGGIIVDGYSQRYEYYINNKDNIRKWLYIENEEKYEKPDENDIIINIRLGDYVQLGWDLPIQYYVEVLKIENFKNAMIVCDDPKSPLLEPLIAMGCKLKDNSSYGKMKFLADFVYVKNSKKCIIANSTFSWWATFLGNGKVYFPCIKFPWIKNAGPDDVDLRVYDEDRYVFVY